MISCLGVPFYVAAVIQFWSMAVYQSKTGTGSDKPSFHVVLVELSIFKGSKLDSFAIMP